MRFLWIHFILIETSQMVQFMAQQLENRSFSARLEDRLYICLHPKQSPFSQILFSLIAQCQATEPCEQEGYGTWNLRNIFEFHRVC